MVGREQAGGAWYFATKGDANAGVDEWQAGQELPAAPRGITFGDGAALRHVGGVPHLGHLGAMADQTTLRMVLVVGSLAGIVVILALGLGRGRLSQRP